MKKVGICVVFFVLLTISLWTADNAIAYVSKVGVDLSTLGSGGANTDVIQVTLPAGLQIFSLPGKPTNPMSARSLREAIKAGGGSLSLIMRLHDRGAFEPYVERLTPDFNISPGRGYLINNASACIVNFQIEKKPSVEPVPFRKGINLIAVPAAGPVMASSLLSALQAGGVGSAYIVGVTNGIFQLYYPPLASTDFTIEPGKGCIVSSAKELKWTPTGMLAKAGSQTNANSKAPASLLLEQAIASQVMSNAKESNRPPILLPIAPAVVLENYTGKLIGFDLDGDSLTYSVSPYPNAGFSLNPSTGEYAWSPKLASSGTYDMTFRVTDGMKTAVQKVQFIIQKPNPPK